MHHMHFLACILFAISSWNKVILTIVSNPNPSGDRPADTALSLESVNNSQHSYLLLDYSTSVKTTNLPPLTSPLSAPAPTAVQATQQHEIGENGKLHGRTHLNGTAFIHQLHQQNMILSQSAGPRRGQHGCEGFVLGVYILDF